MKISVIIPVYNVEKYLPECIDSVLRQTYEDYEIILVDDGSKDSSGEICDRYASGDSRICVFHKENGGLSDARNYGLSKITGDCVLFLDSDDFLSETALEDTICLIEKEKCDFVFFDALSFNDENRNYSIKQNYIRKNDYPAADGLTVLLNQLKHKEYHSQVCMMLFRREFLEKNKLTFYNDLLYEDMLFTFQTFCKSEKVAYLKKALYHRRYRSGSIVMSKPQKKNFVSAKTVFEEVCRFAEKQKITDSATAKLYCAKCAFNAMNMYKRVSKAAQKECRAEYKCIKNLCRKNDYFGDKALEMRCYGKAFWLIYKIITKLFKVKK